LPPDLARIVIDGREVVARKGASLLHTCLDHGAPVPYFCDHRKLDPIGACRMCVVQIEKQPKLATACTITVADGMVVNTGTPDVLKAREGVLEFLLINHPLDCPVCDKGGECDLQDFSFYHGVGQSRFIEEKLKYPKPVPLSERILLDMERCVLCERCVRYFDEVTEESELVLLNRGVHTMIGTFNGEPMESNFQGNIMELCPVGALTSADWRFSARPWDMRSTPSVCSSCAMGCNVQVQTRDERLVRLMTRDNPAIDDGWLCDRGRYGFHYVNAPERLLTPMLRRGEAAAGPRHLSVHEKALGLVGEVTGGGAAAGTLEPVEIGTAVAAVAARLQAIVGQHGAASVGAIAGPEATNEELFLFQRWIREVVGTPHLDHRTALHAPVPEPDDFALAIEDLGERQVVFVLGDQATVDLAPVLELRLKRARRRHRTRLVLAHGRPVSQLLEELYDGETRVGIVSAEAQTEDATILARRLLEPAGRPDLATPDQPSVATGSQPSRTPRDVRRLTVLTHANSRGAADMGCLPELLPGYRAVTGRPGMGTWEMLEAAAAGRLKALIVLGPTPLAAQRDNPLLVNALARLELLVALDIAPNAITEAAHVVIPLHTFAEKDGTYTNLDGHIQRLRQAIPPVAGTPPDWRVLQDLANAWEAGWSYRQPAEVMRDIVAAVPAYGVARAGDRARWWDTAATPRSDGAGEAAPGAAPTATGAGPSPGGSVP
ncbi:MAG TPA: molybdopterin-dependent oxidoreductase, partial [Candidatus Dormibacteraeota bacterium]|nr:molybdopterin-dependent oxidoreductase [Candidatus Dormibacteraeota bacterium]